MNLGDKVSILIPARNEERILPSTLPTVIRSASELPSPVEIVVIAPRTSVVHTNPPLSHPMLRWVATDEIGKSHAVKAGAAAADGDVLILVDADVIVEPETLVHLLRPIAADTADIVAGRIDVLPRARTPAQHLLERWASNSMNAWDLFRKAQPEFLWALPGAIYAIRRQYLPGNLLMALVDDASIGLQAADNGAVFAYAPLAVARTPAPSTYSQWMRQKFRSRRGWAALARFRQAEVAAIESAFRPYLAMVSKPDPTSWLMHAQDRLLRLAARGATAVNPVPSGAWKPGRGEKQWPLVRSPRTLSKPPLIHRVEIEEPRDGAF